MSRKAYQRKDANYKFARYRTRVAVGIQSKRGSERRAAPKGSGPGAGAILYPDIVFTGPKKTNWRRAGRRPIPEEVHRGRHGIRVWQPVCGYIGRSGTRGGSDGARVSGSGPCPGAAATVAVHGEFTQYSGIPAS